MTTRWAGVRAAWVAAALLLAGGPALAEERLHVVIFEDAPLAERPRSARGRERLANLARRQAEREGALEASLHRPLAPVFRYRAAANGLAARLTPEEAAALRGLPGVRAVREDVLHRVLTDRTPTFVGASQLFEDAAGTTGEGVVVGVIDTGVNLDHPSFAALGDDGHLASNPNGPGVFLGWCDPAHPEHQPSYVCNDKLIGAWDFVDGLGLEEDGPEDDDDHGSHVAGTAVGNRLDLDGDGTLDVSGIAPHASLVAYDACYDDVLLGDSFCPHSALLAAIDRAVLDGVDVINFSISGGGDPWAAGDVDEAFLAAVEAGVLVVAATGNDGPASASVEHRGPWVLSVAAATHDRSGVVAELVDAAGGDAPPGPIAGSTRAGSYGPAPVVLARDFANGDANPEQCLHPFPPGTWLAGEIVLCDRGEIARVEKCANAAAGGAGGCILGDVPGGDPLGEVADVHAVPALHVDADEAETLRAWLSEGAGHTARITEPVVVLDPLSADVLSVFSARGPATGLDVLKPDLTAPGVDVFAAGRDDTFDVPGLIWRINAGTSMASPHVAGAGALLRALHPGWTPREVASALTLAAVGPVRDDDGVTEADAFAAGAGRLAVARAAATGLVLDQDAAGFRAADPEAGGEPSELNVPSWVEGDCFRRCGFTRTFRSTATAATMWGATIEAPPGLDVSIEPQLLSIAAGATASVAVDVAVVDPARVGAWSFASLRLVAADPALPELRLPLAVLPSAADPGLPVLPLDAEVAARVKLRFDRSARDQVKLALKWFRPSAPFDPAGAAFLLDVGGVRLEGALDARGRYKADGTKIRLKRKRNGTFTLKAKRTRASLAAELADEGLLDEDNAKPGKAVDVDVALEIEGGRYEAPVALRYRSKAGKKGSAR